MTWNVGDVFRSKTGELLKVMEFSETQCKFQMLNPLTTEPTRYFLEGPIKSLKGMHDELKLELIDLKTYVPTGLVKGEKSERQQRDNISAD